MTLTNLIARIEAAPEPDPDLFSDAWDMLGPLMCWTADQARRFGNLLAVEAYLDAAAMLVPEGAWFVLHNVMGPQPLTRDLFEADVLAEGGKNRPVYFGSPCAHPALALCAAALRAIATKEDK
jgi:hypothetical protein